GIWDSGTRHSATPVADHPRSRNLSSRLRQGPAARPSRIPSPRPPTVNRIPFSGNCLYPLPRKTGRYSTQGNRRLHTLIRKNGISGESSENLPDHKLTYSPGIFPSV